MAAGYSLEQEYLGPGFQPQGSAGGFTPHWQRLGAVSRLRLRSRDPERTRFQRRILGAGGARLGSAFSFPLALGGAGSPALEALSSPHWGQKQDADLTCMGSWNGSG